MMCPSCQAECPEQSEACFTCGKALFALTQGSLLASRYEVLSPLGKGGMSRVYEAYDHVLGEPVAIKVLRSELAWEPEMRQRFLHEIRLARRVSHPNVCRIHEYGEDGSLHYISMELLSGANLKDVLRNRGLSTEEAFELALQMADGLHAVHQHGIIHRDLKASNIMIDRQGVAKLMDFGIAKQAEADTSGFTTPGQVLGTPEYMSPEHARGAKVDFRSDIYAIGCVIFEIFTGQAPFRGPNAFATISKHFYEPVPLDGPLATLIPEPLVPVLRKALSKEPSRRYGGVAELKEALRQAQTAAVGDPPPSPDRVGSPRLARLCEGLLSRVPTGAAPPGDDDEAGHPHAAPLVRPALAAPPPKGNGGEKGPAPPVAIEAESAPPSAGTPPAPVRRRRLLLASALGVGLVGVAWSMLLWPETAGRAARSEAGTATVRSAPARPPGSAGGSAPAVQAAAPAVPPEPPRAQVEASRSGVSSTSLGAPRPAAPAPPSSPPQRPSGKEPASERLAGLWTQRETATAAERDASPPAARAAPAEVAPPATGTLRVLVVPWAEVTVDGDPNGRVSLREIPLPPGSHVVRVVHPDYQPLQRKVTIHAGAVTDLVLDLAEKGVRKVF